MIDIRDSPSSCMPSIAGYHVLRRIDAGGQAAVYAAVTTSSMPMAATVTRKVAP